MKRIVIGGLFLCGVGCELPWRSASLSMSSDRWTDQVHVEMRISDIGGALFQCSTHQNCVENIQASLAVPDAAGAAGSRPVKIGAELVEGGAHDISLQLIEAGDSVDLVGSFSAPSGAKVFQNVWLPKIDNGPRPTLSMSNWNIVSPANLPTSGGLENGVLVTYVDLTKAPKTVVFEAKGNEDVLPLYLAIPGLKHALHSAGLVTAP